MKTKAWLGFFACALAFITGCGSSSGGGSTDVTISGTLSTVRAYSDDSVMTMEEIENYGRADLSVYKVRCVTLAGTPVAGEGTCDSSGNFSVNMAGATGQQMGCFILQGTTVVGSVVFESSTQGIDGSNTQAGSYLLGSGGGNYKFGTVTLDLNTGLAKVTESGILTPSGGTGTGTPTGTWANVKGTWNLTCIDPPSGDNVYSKCDTRPEPPPPGGGGDHGVPKSIYFNQIDGIKDAGGKAHSFLSIWENETVFKGCGSNEGISLPSGFVTTDTSLVNPMTLDTLDQSKVKPQCFAPPACTLQADTTNGNNQLTNPFFQNCAIIKGSALSGPGIPPSTTITEVIFGGPGTPPSITMSNNATATATGISVNVTPIATAVCGAPCTQGTTTCADVTNVQGWTAQIGLEGTSTNGSNTLSGVQFYGPPNGLVGKGIFGPGIPNGTTVTATTSNTVTMSQNATSSTPPGQKMHFGVGSGVTFSNADCQAMCVAQNIWQLENNGGGDPTRGCPARWDVRWDLPPYITNAGHLACTGTGCGNNSGADYVKRRATDARFIAGELVIFGNTASVVAINKRENDHICINPGANGCEQIKCPNAEKVTFNMIQIDANNATADVKIERSLAPGSDAKCSTAAPGNFLAESLTPRRYLIKAARARAGETVASLE